MIPIGVVGAGLDPVALERRAAASSTVLGARQPGRRGPRARDGHARARRNRINIVFSLVFTPLLFTGLQPVPVAVAGHAAAGSRCVTALNPMTYVSEGMRAALVPEVPHIRPWICLLVLVGSLVVLHVRSACGASTAARSTDAAARPDPRSVRREAHAADDERPRARRLDDEDGVRARPPAAAGRWAGRSGSGSTPGAAPRRPRGALAAAGQGGRRRAAPVVPATRMRAARQPLRPPRRSSTRRRPERASARRARRSPRASAASARRGVRPARSAVRAQALPAGRCAARGRAAEERGRQEGGGGDAERAEGLRRGRDSHRRGEPSGYCLREDGGRHARIARARRKPAAGRARERCGPPPRRASRWVRGAAARPAPRRGRRRPGRRAARTPRSSRSSCSSSRCRTQFYKAALRDGQTRRCAARISRARSARRRREHVRMLAERVGDRARPALRPDFGAALRTTPRRPARRDRPRGAHRSPPTSVRART